MVFTEVRRDSRPGKTWRLNPSVRLSCHDVETLSVLIDCATIIIACSIGQAVYGIVARAPHQHITAACGVALLACMLHAPIAFASGQYRLHVLTQPVRYMKRTVLTTAMVGLSLTAVLFLLKTDTGVSHGALVGFVLLQGLFLIIARLTQGTILRRGMMHGVISGQPIVIIGEGGELARLNTRMLTFQFGYREAGRITLTADGSDAERVRHAIELARHNGAEGFGLAMDWADTDRLSEVQKLLRASPLAVHLLPDSRSRSVLMRHSGDEIARSMQILLQRAPLTRFDCLAKRLFDIVFSAIALCLLAPLLLLVALAVKFDSPGPIIFRQQRKGFNQKPFSIYKFRSMTVLEDGAAVVQASRNDRRVTSVGRLLRRTSIDEIPQLINVLQGTMSLVGPRPHALAHDDHYGERIDTYCLRHHVKPGITGWAQVKGFRGETARIQDMQARIELDVWYVNNWSTTLDLMILLQTCFAVFAHDAY